MSDPLEEAYYKYVNPPPEVVQQDSTCPFCGSRDVDNSRGYRGEYSCRNCGKFWKK